MPNSKNYPQGDSNLNSQGVANKELNKDALSQGVHNTVHNRRFSPELQQIIDAWPKLPNSTKASITKLAKAAVNIKNKRH